MNPHVYPLLAASSALTALVGDGIYRKVKDQDAPAPYVVWTPAGISTEICFGSEDDVDYDRVSIDCWANEDLEAEAIAAAARAALRGHGYLASGFSDYEAETALYRVSFDWSFITTPV